MMKRAAFISFALFFIVQLFLYDNSIDSRLYGWPYEFYDTMGPFRVWPLLKNILLLGLPLFIAVLCIQVLLNARNER